MSTHRRNLVTRPDGRRVNVARYRGQLFVCATGCCCGRSDDGFAEVPTALYHDQWERRRLRNVVHLTVGGCLGPCALANVVLLLFDSQALWFHSIDSERLVVALYDYIDAMLDADRCLPAPAALAPHHFTASAWQARPDGEPVDDRRRLKSGSSGASAPSPSPVASCASESDAGDEMTEARLHQRLTELGGSSTVPRKNGELVFDAPWQGRAFGMAVALSEQGVFAWETFRQALIVEIAAAEARGGEFRYYDAWLAALERVLAGRALMRTDELDETTFQFEFGERDDVV